MQRPRGGPLGPSARNRLRRCTLRPMLLPRRVDAPFVLLAAAVCALGGCAINHAAYGEPPQDTGLDAAFDGVRGDTSTDSVKPPIDTGVADAPCGRRDEVCCGDGTCTANLQCWIDMRCRCGDPGQPCCAAATLPARCNPDTECVSEQCRCGRQAEICCTGRMCDTGFVCDAGGRCNPPVTCAMQTESCAGGRACCAGLMCEPGSMTCLPIPTCAGAGAMCIGGVCCPGLMCDGSFRCVTPPVCIPMGSPCGAMPCCAGNTCQSGTCAPPPACGGVGQNCCSGARCAAGNTCVSPFGLPSSCIACGAPGQACCVGGGCTGGSYCRMASASGFYCVHDTYGRGNGERCIVDVGAYRNCSTNVICRGTNPYERCLFCGLRNQPCCSALRCAAGLTCRDMPSGSQICVLP